MLCVCEKSLIKYINSQRFNKIPQIGRRANLRDFLFCSNNDLLNGALAQNLFGLFESLRIDLVQDVS